MSYKPYRGSGIVFDTHLRKMYKYRRLAISMYNNNEHIEPKNLNRFSKYIYLAWLNDKKVSLSASLDVHMFNDLIKNMLMRNIDKIYKPLAKELQKRQLAESIHIRTFELFGQKTSVDIKKLGADLHALHTEKGSDAVLAFGMLDAELMKSTEVQLQTKLEDAYNQYSGDIFHDELTNFVKGCMNAIAKEVYKNSKMVV